MDNVSILFLTLDKKIYFVKLIIVIITDIQKIKIK
jgi:hypothetical protein